MLGPPLLIRPSYHTNSNHSLPFFIFLLKLKGISTTCFYILPNTTPPHRGIVVQFDRLGRVTASTAARINPGGLFALLSLVLPKFPPSAEDSRRLSQNNIFSTAIHSCIFRRQLIP